MHRITDFPIDYKLEASIRHRRILETQRKARIFNPRQRIIGLDVDGLDQQVHDKKSRNTNERHEHEQIAKQMVQADHVAGMTEKKKREALRSYKEEIDAYRKYNQYPATRREFDIYDPDRLKKDEPTRVCDDDPKLSVSGLQKLDGEDLKYQERMKEQKKQFSEWMRLQMEENKAKKMHEKNMENLFDQQFRHMCLKSSQLRTAELETKRQVNVDMREYNKRLAEDLQLHKQHMKLEEDQKKLQEIHDAFYSDMLTENPEVARSSFGPHRVVTDRWKGMSPGQLHAVYDGQKYQILEDERKKMREEHEKAEWDRQLIHQCRGGILNERQQKRDRRQMNKELCLMNHELAREQASHNEYLNKVVYTNPPTEDYFAQFNTTTR